MGLPFLAPAGLGQDFAKIGMGLGIKALTHRYFFKPIVPLLHGMIAAPAQPTSEAIKINTSGPSVTTVVQRTRALRKVSTAKLIQSMPHRIHRFLPAR
jgi:hypothetical protein